MTKKALKETFNIDYPMSLGYYMFYVSSRSLIDKERWKTVRAYQRWVCKPLTRNDLEKVFGFKNSIHHKSFMVCPSKKFHVLFRNNFAEHDGCKLLIYNDLIRECEKEKVKIELKQ